MPSFSCETLNLVQHGRLCSRSIYLIFRIASLPQIHGSLLPFSFYFFYVFQPLGCYDFCFHIIFCLYEHGIEGSRCPRYYSIFSAVSHNYFFASLRYLIALYDHDLALPRNPVLLPLIRSLAQILYIENTIIIFILHVRYNIFRFPAFYAWSMAMINKFSYLQFWPCGGRSVLGTILSSTYI